MHAALERRQERGHVGGGDMMLITVIICSISTMNSMETFFLVLMSCRYPGYGVTADPSPAHPARHVDTQLFSHFHTNLQKLDTCCCCRTSAAGKAAPDVPKSVRWGSNEDADAMDPPPPLATLPPLPLVSHSGRSNIFCKFFGSKIKNWHTFLGSW